MEASALKHPVAGLQRSPLLRLQSDERLVALVRRGNAHAFEVLVARYQARLLAFSRHMLGSREDAEDVLQEVFAAAYNAMLADEREINVRPWLYRIARNRSLNHLRRAQAVGVDSMDVHFADGGISTADKVHRREEFRQLVADVQDLPETQRTALLLREIDVLSYEQIAEAMETTVPSVKSLLVRARVSLAEAAEARLLTCEQVRHELGEVAEGLARTTPPVRRHLRTCERCQTFRKQLRETNKALAAVFPIGPLLLLKKLVLAHLGASAAAGGGGAAAAGTGVAAGGAMSGAAAASGALGAGMGAVAGKAAVGLAAAAVVTAGAVEVRHARSEPVAAAPAALVAQAPPRSVPAAPALTPALAAPALPAAAAEDELDMAAARESLVAAAEEADAAAKAALPTEAPEAVAATAEPLPEAAATAPAVPPVDPAPAATDTAAPEAPATADPVVVEQHDSDTTVLPAPPVPPSPPTAPTVAPAPAAALPPAPTAVTPVTPEAPVAPEPATPEVPVAPEAPPAPVEPEPVAPTP